MEKVVIKYMFSEEILRAGREALTERIEVRKPIRRLLEKREENMSEGRAMRLEKSREASNIPEGPGTSWM